jgi:hypothetical protein
MEAATMATKQARKSQRPEFSDYEPVEEKTLAKRIAHFLNWCAENRAKEVIPLNQIASTLFGLKQMPRMTNDAVVLVQKTMSRVRPILIEKYKRSLVSVPGIGVRATVDSADIVKTELAKNVRRMDLAAARTAQVFNLVDPAQLPNTEEFKPWKEWFNRQLSGNSGLFKMITSNDWAKRVALPPKPEEGKP